MTPHDCPYCGAPSSYREQLSDSWEFCNSCARAYVLDAEGKPTRVTGTNHAPRRVERDVSNVLVTGES